MSLHVFSNISLALSEGLLDDVVDSFLQVFELGSYDFMNSVIEVINFNVDGVYLVFEFDGKALEAMGWLDSCGLEIKGLAGYVLDYLSVKCGGNIVIELIASVLTLLIVLELSEATIMKASSISPIVKFIVETMLRAFQD